MQNDFIGLEDFVKGSRAFSVDADPVDIKLLMAKYKSVGGGNGGKAKQGGDSRENYDYL